MRFGTNKLSITSLLAYLLLSLAALLTVLREAGCGLELCAAPVLSLKMK